MSDEIKRIIPVKSCYSHIGGWLGNLLMEQFIEKEWVKKTESNERLYITAQEKYVVS